MLGGYFFFGVAFGVPPELPPNGFGGIVTPRGGPPAFVFAVGFADGTAGGGGGALAISAATATLEGGGGAEAAPVSTGATLAAARAELEGAELVVGFVARGGSSDEAKMITRATAPTTATATSAAATRNAIDLRAGSGNETREGARGTGAVSAV